MEGVRLYGLGVADAKAQISAFVYAVAALRSVGRAGPGNVQLTFVVDEESGACSPYGTHYLLELGFEPPVVPVHAFLVKDDLSGF